MTDFLSGLLDRTLGRALVLQRRRPTLFEPTNDAPGLSRMSSASLWQGAEEEDHDLESFDVPQPRRRVAPQPRPSTPSRQPPAAEHPVPEIARRPKFVAPATSSPGRQADREPQEIAAPPPLPERNSKANRSKEPARASGPSVEKILEKPGPTTIALAPRLVARSEPPIVAPARVEPLPAARLVQPDRQDPAGETKPHRADPPKGEAGGSLVQLSRSMVREYGPPHPHPAISRPQHANAREAAPAPPTIHVTIGRIEVRATPAATPPPRDARRAGPKLNLEDYLRTRGGGSK